MDELGVDERQPGGHCPNVNQLLAEPHFLVMRAEQEKEKRRLVMATLEVFLEGVRGRSSGVAGVQELQNETAAFCRDSLGTSLDSQKRNVE
jgi:hypothetical protein